MKDIFISYSRKDKEFALRLYQAFQDSGREVWVDWENIPLTAQWLKEIYAGIEAADDFVFVITPDSVASEVCAQELAHAVAHNKRLVPILHQDVTANAVAPALGSHNWIFFRDSDDFDTAFESLITALDTDLDWVHGHTRLLTRAIEWDSHKRENSFILHGTDLKGAEVWLSQAGAAKHRSPTPLQTEYILHSRRIINRRYRQAVSMLSVGVCSAIVLSLLIWQGKIRQRHYQAAKYQEEGVLALLQNDAQRAEILFANALTLDDHSETRDWLLQARARAARIRWIGPQHPASAILTLSADARRCVSRSRNGVLRVETVGEDTAAPLTLEGTSAVQSAAFSADDRKLALGERNGSIHLFRLTKTTVRPWLVLHAKSVQSLAFAPDGRQLAVGGADQNILLWDLLTADKPRRLTGHKGAVLCLAFSPNGHLLASGSADYHVGLWQVDTGKRNGPWLEGHEDNVVSLAFSADGKRLASGSDDNSIRLWEVPTGRHLRLLTHKQLGHNGSVHSVAFSSNGTRLASGSDDKSVRLWDVEGEEPDAWNEVVTLTCDESMTSVAFSSDGSKLAAASGDGLVHAWDIAGIGNTDEMLTLRGHRKQITSGNFSPDGTLLASTSADKTVRLWDVRTGKEKYIGRKISAMTDQVSSVGFSPDGKVLASGGKDGTIRLWDVRTGKQKGKPLLGHQDQVWTVAFTPDGRLLVSSSDDGAVRFWDPETRRPLGKFTDNGGKVPGLALSRDGGRLATGSEDGCVRLWKISTEGSGTALQVHLTKLAQMQIQPTTLIWNVAFSPDGRQIAVGGQDGSVRLWDIESRQQARILGFHEGPVWDIAFSPNAHTVASAGNDAKVRLWSTDKEEFQTLSSEAGPVWFVAFNNDGQMLATGNQDKTVVIWRLDKIDQIREAPPWLLSAAASRETGLRLDLKSATLHSLSPTEFRTLSPK